MARNVKPGITFYRMDSGHILNKKVRLLFNEFDSDGYYVWKCLCDHGYMNNGYFFDMRDQEGVELFCSDYCKKPIQLVQQIIEACIRRGLFHAGIAADHKILTSVMMQEVFIYATADRRKKGSVFEMPADWLLLQFDIVPGNIVIIPGKKAIPPGRNDLVPGRNSQTRQDESSNNTRVFVPRQAGPIDNKNENDQEKETGAKKEKGTRRKIFIKPTLEEVKAFFMLQYQPKNPGTWFPDRCNREADDFFDFYTGNGWVQGKAGKPIVDWNAAARRWIRTAKDGTYGSSFAKPADQHIQQQPAASASQRSDINEDEKTINFLYDRFIEEPGSVNYQSIETSNYQRLKDKGLISFSTDQTEKIKLAAAELIKELQLQPDDKLLVTYMKKIGVIEFFKKCQADGRQEIFKL